MKLIQFTHISDKQHIYINPECVAWVYSRGESTTCVGLVGNYEPHGKSAFVVAEGVGEVLSRLEYDGHPRRSAFDDFTSLEAL